MTKPGTVVTIPCLSCEEDIVYTYVSGRLRKYHDVDHKNAAGKLTHCHRNWSNNNQREIRANRLRAEDEARIQAQVDDLVEARLNKLADDHSTDRLLSTSGRRQFGGWVWMTARQLRRLVEEDRTVEGTEETLALYKEIILQYEETLNDKVIPLLEEISKAME